METQLVVTDEMRELLAPLLDLDKQGWKQLEQLIDDAQDHFAQRLRADYPCLSEDDIQIILLIRSGLTHQEIAKIGNIQLKSFRMRRWRIKQKMKIDCDSFTEFIKHLYKKEA